MKVLKLFESPKKEYLLLPYREAAGAETVACLAAVLKGVSDGQ